MVLRGRSGNSVRYAASLHEGNRMPLWRCRMKDLLPAAMVLLALSGLPSSGQDKKDYDPVIDPANFVEDIDNPFHPLPPGTTYVYEGETEDGLVHEEVYVTHNTRVILGVTCTEVRHREWEDGTLVEDTLDWFAQDVDGNVWYFGEFATEFDNGDISHEGSWEAGVDGAKPGIIMLADPQHGRSYRQEFSEGIAEDMGKVLRLNASVSIEYGDFDGVLETKEWSPLEPGHVEHKYYAEGIGLVLVREQKSGKILIELVDILNE